MDSHALRFTNRNFMKGRMLPQFKYVIYLTQLYMTQFITSVYILLSPSRIRCRFPLKTFEQVCPVKLKVSTKTIVHSVNHGIRRIAESNILQQFSYHTCPGYIGKWISIDDRAANSDSHYFSMTKSSTSVLADRH